MYVPLCVCGGVVREQLPGAGSLFHHMDVRDQSQVILAAGTLSPAWSLFCFALKQGLPGFPVFLGSLELGRQTRLTQPCINPPASDFWASECVCAIKPTWKVPVWIFLCSLGCGRVFHVYVPACTDVYRDMCIQVHECAGTSMCAGACVHACTHVGRPGVKSGCCSSGIICLGFDSGSLIDLKLSD